MFESLAAERTIELTLYTDAYVIRGTVQTRQTRLSDVLNRSEEPFIVVEQAVFDEYGTRGEVLRSEYAQVNLATVLFAVSNVVVEATPELRMPKTQSQAIVVVPPFKITGTIHLMPEENFRNALRELTGRFLPVTDATYWSDSLGEPRTTTAVVAVNHDRAQILAPHQVVDPWAGMPAAATGQAGETTAEPTDAASGTADDGPAPWQG
jgi:hypothetical protein